MVYKPLIKYHLDEIIILFFQYERLISGQLSHTTLMWAMQLRPGSIQFTYVLVQR